MSDYVAAGRSTTSEIVRRPEGRRPRLLDGRRSSRCPTTAARPGATSASATSTSTTTRSGSIPTTPTTTCVGCDGGLYESFDRGGDLALHRQPAGHAVLPRGRATTRCPFYNVYGGTQDNFTLGGPVAHAQPSTASPTATGSSPWAATASTRAVDPEDPNIVYAELAARRPRRASTGGPASASASSRSRRRARRRCAGTGTRRSLISPHSPHAALLRRAAPLPQRRPRRHAGRPISGDLTRQIDRNKLPVMGKVWGVDAVAKNGSTSLLRQHRLARRVAAAAKACSTSAPTTASSR